MEEKEKVKDIDREEAAEVEQTDVSGETTETAEETSDLGKLQAEVDRQKDAFLRLNAEFQNFKKRTEKEKTDIYKFANEKVFLDLLEVMDNVERAVQAFEADEEENPFFGGLRQIKKSFQDIFNKYGLERIEAVGAPFDPELHHAVMTEDAEDADSEVVIEELQKGYTLNGKVIRHAMVKVAK